MGWENVNWSCGHEGRKQLYGKRAGRDATVAYEAGRPCMVCWLISSWEADDDPRANHDERIDLAKKIARGKGVDVVIEAPETSEDDVLRKEREALSARIAEINNILGEEEV